jgi:hypothetical protein
LGKRHILTDTGGLLVTALVHGANIQDRDGAPAVLASRGTFIRSGEQGGTKVCETEREYENGVGEADVPASVVHYISEVSIGIES